MIARGPGVSGRGQKTSAYATVMDMAPTFLELGGATYPDDGSVRPMLGESLAGLLAGKTETAHDESYATIFLHNDRAFLRPGRWKISNLTGPFDESAFELFDLVADPGETAAHRPCPAKAAATRPGPATARPCISSRTGP